MDSHLSIMDSSSDTLYSGIHSVQEPNSGEVSHSYLCHIHYSLHDAMCITQIFHSIKCTTDDVRWLVT